MALSYAQVYELARGAGLSREQAITATAIARAESGHDPHAVGDTSLTDATWGPSVGLWQVRSLKAEYGTGLDRDVTQLRDPAFNARAMASISGGGTNWRPWSVYTSGTYRRYLPAARQAAGDPRATDQTDAPTAQNAGWWDPPGPDGLYGPLGYADDLLGWGADVTGLDPADAITKRLTSMAADTVPYAAALLLGVALLGIGAWRATSRSAQAVIA